MEIITKKMFKHSNSMPVAEVGACESVARRLHGVTCTLDVSRKSLPIGKFPN